MKIHLLRSIPAYVLMYLQRPGSSDHCTRCKADRSPEGTPWRDTRSKAIDYFRSSVFQSCRDYIILYILHIIIYNIKYILHFALCSAGLLDAALSCVPARGRSCPVSQPTGCQGVPGIPSDPILRHDWECPGGTISQKHENEWDI